MNTLTRHMTQQRSAPPGPGAAPPASGPTANQKPPSQGPGGVHGVTCCVITGTISCEQVMTIKHPLGAALAPPAGGKQNNTAVLLAFL